MKASNFARSNKQRKFPRVCAKTGNTRTCYTSELAADAALGKSWAHLSPGAKAPIGYQLCESCSEDGGVYHLYYSKEELDGEKEV
jgi:hypothetical protein